MVIAVIGPAVGLNVADTLQVLVTRICGGSTSPGSLDGLDPYVPVPRSPNENCAMLALTRAIFAAPECRTMYQRRRPPRSNTRDSLNRDAHALYGGAAADDARVSVALALIAEVDGHGLRVSVIAARVGLSRWHLEKLLRQSTGRSFTEHVRSARVTAAIRVLGIVHLSIKEAAGHCGYLNTAAMARDFRRSLDISPGVWRSHSFGARLYPRDGPESSVTPPGPSDADGAMLALTQVIAAAPALRAMYRLGRVHDSAAKGSTDRADLPPCRTAAEHDAVDPRVLLALAIIAEVAGHGVTVSVVSSRVDLSRWHFEKLLRQSTGRSFTEHVRSARVSAALPVLGLVRLSIKEVAARCGYLSTAALTRDFRRCLDISPAVWRSRSFGARLYALLEARPALELLN